MAQVIRAPIPDERATESLAARVAPCLRGGDVVELRGDLGAGKTTFVRYLFAALGGESDAIKSPTFSIIDVHELTNAGGHARLFVHADLYRIDDRADVAATGIGDYVEDLACIVAVEWPEIGDAMWQPAHRLTFTGTGEERLVCWSQLD